MPLVILLKLCHFSVSQFDETGEKVAHFYTHRRSSTTFLPRVIQSNPSQRLDISPPHYIEKQTSELTLTRDKCTLRPEARICLIEHESSQSAPVSLPVHWVIGIVSAPLQRSVPTLNQKSDIASPLTAKLRPTTCLPRSISFLDLKSRNILLKSLESLWNSRKMGKRATQDSKLSEMEAYNQLLLSTLGRDHDYAVNIYRRLHRRHFAHVTPESLLEEIRGGDAEEEKAKKKGYSLKHGSVFKVPLLSHSSKNIGSGGASMANAATSGLMKMGGVVKKGFHKGKKERFKHGSMNITKNAASTLNIRRGHKKKSATNAGERHSVAEIEQLASRMSAAATLGGPIRRGTPSESSVATLKSEGFSRHLSNLSDFVSHSSSEDGVGGESPSSSLSIDGGIQRISSQSSLLARTQELLDQYLAPPPVIRSPSPPGRSSGSPSKQ